MSKYNLISVIALLVLVAILPLYAIAENIRLQHAQADLQAQFISDGSALYIQNCASCHGVEGEGIGMNPPMNKMGMAQADPKLLFRTIARAAHGSSMAAWHIAEGGSLDEYQIQELVTLIRFGDWSKVAQLASERGVYPEEVSTMDIEESYLAGLNEGDPHQCISCHEEPEVHEESFGLDCVRCHSLVAWTPALLTRHTFRLDHGDEGTVACETCHIGTYTENSCYECHDHTPDDMDAVHTAEQILDYENCIACHPTGAPDEAKQYMDSVLAGQ